MSFCSSCSSSGSTVNNNQNQGAGQPQTGQPQAGQLAGQPQTGQIGRSGPLRSSMEDSQASRVAHSRVESNYRSSISKAPNDAAAPRSPSHSSLNNAHEYSQKEFDSHPEYFPASLMNRHSSGVERPTRSSRPSRNSTMNRLAIGPLDGRAEEVAASAEKVTSKAIAGTNRRLTISFPGSNLIHSTSLPKGAPQPQSMEDDAHPFSVNGDTVQDSPVQSSSSAREASHTPSAANTSRTNDVESARLPANPHPSPIIVRSIGSSSFAPKNGRQILPSMEATKQNVTQQGASQQAATHQGASRGQALKSLSSPGIPKSSSLSLAASTDMSASSSGAIPKSSSSSTISRSLASSILDRQSHSPGVPKSSSASLTILQMLQGDSVAGQKVDNDGTNVEEV